MATPPDFPRGSLDLLRPLTWAPSGTATQPSADRLASGRASGEALPAAEFNWLHQTVMSMAAALWARTPLASSRLFGSWVERNGYWIDGTNALEAVLSDADETDPKVADVWLDPDGTGAVKVQVVATPAAPITLQATRTHYIHVPIASATAGRILASDLDVEIVALNAASAGTPADHVTVWRINTGASAITSSTILLPTSPIFLDIATDNLDVGGDLTLDGGDLLGVNEAAITTLVVGAGGIDSTEATNVLGDVDADTIVTGSLSVPFALLAENTVGTITAYVPATFEGAVTVENDLDVTGQTNCFDGLTVDGSAFLVTGVGSSATFACDVETGVGTTLTLNGSLNGLGSITAGFRFVLTATTSLASGDMSVDASGYPRFRASDGTKYFDRSSSGRVRASGYTTSLSAASTITLSTSAAVAPLATSDLIIEAKLWLARAIAGDVTVSIEEVSGEGTLGTSENFPVAATGSGKTLIWFARRKSSATTGAGYIYRVSVAGGGSNVTGYTCLITVAPAT
jgi:hypothetical protein